MNNDLLTIIKAKDRWINQLLQANDYLITEINKIDPERVLPAFVMAPQKAHDVEGENDL
jgi:hypothetical protein